MKSSSPRWRHRGYPSEIQGTPGFVKAATVRDPEGNEIAFAEDLTNKT